MLDSMSSNSLELQGEEYDPEILAGAPVHRHSTNVLELSRIISGVRDDRELDNIEFESYKDVPDAEAVLIAQADEATQDITRQPTAVEADNDHPIDGAFAFWQAFLVMLMVFATWGANAAFGVFLNYYMTSDSFPGASKYDFALIGGLVVFLAQILAPISAVLVRVFGQTPVHIVGVVFQTVAYFLAAECKKKWQIYLCQGVMVGTSFLLIFLPGTMVLPTWFDKRRSTSMGIAVAGAGLGGVVFSLSLNKLLERTGDQKWPLRAVGFITLAVSAFGTAFLRPRNYKKPDYKVTLSWAYVRATTKVVFDWRVFNNYPMTLTGIWFGLALLGYVIILYSFSSYATSVGLSHTQANNLLAIMNGAQVVGRPLVGNFGDYFGRHNMGVSACLYIAIMVLAFWTQATSYASLIVLAVVLGGLIGVGSTMAQLLASDVLKMQGRQEKLGAAWSGLNIIVSIFSLPAEVIALSLSQPTKGQKSYYHSQIFTGCIFLLAAIVLLINREYLVRGTFLTRKAAAEDQLHKLRNCYLRREKLEQPDGELSDSEEVLEERIARYTKLLHPGFVLVRAFYPIRI